MPILVFTILTPTLAFYFYALVQFWIEFRRRSPEMRIVVLRDSRLAAADFEPFPDPDSELDRRAANVVNAGNVEMIRRVTIPATGAPVTPGPGRAEVLTTYLKSRHAGYAAQTGRLAVKRAAKG
jgi:hypothetical protein